MRAFLRGFGCAGRGFLTAVKSECNLRFHLCAAVYVYLLSLFYGFSRAEYALLTVIVGGVIALELVNTAIERIVNRLSPGWDKTAGAIKDIAAGAVLVFSVAAAVCGFMLFWRAEVFAAIGAFFMARWWLLVLLAASLAGSGWFVFGFGRERKKRMLSQEDTKHNERHT